MGVVGTAVKLALEGRDSGRSLFEQVQRIQEMKRQQAEREEAARMQEAQFGLQADLSEISDPTWSRDKTPAMMAPKLASINLRRQALGLEPVGPEILTKARDEAFMPDFGDGMQKFAQLHADDAKYGEDLYMYYLQNRYDTDYLSGRTLMMHNTDRMQQSQAPADANGKPAVEDKKPEQATATALPTPVGLVPDWEQTARKMYREYAKPVTDLKDVIGLPEKLAKYPVETLWAVGLTKDGPDKLKSLGKVWGVDPTLYDTDQTAFNTQLTAKALEYQKKRVRASGGKYMVQMGGELRRWRQQGSTPEAIAQAFYQDAVTNGFEGELSDFTSMVAAMPTIAPAARATLDERIKGRLQATGLAIMNAIKGQSLDARTANQLGATVWDSLIAAGSVPKDAKMPDWTQITKKNMTPAEQWSAFLRIAGIKFDVAKYLANSEDPNVVYDPFAGISTPGEVAPLAVPATGGTISIPGAPPVTTDGSADPFHTPPMQGAGRVSVSKLPATAGKGATSNKYTWPQYQKDLAKAQSALVTANAQVTKARTDSVEKNVDTDPAVMATKESYRTAAEAHNQITTKWRIQELSKKLKPEDMKQLTTSLSNAAAAGKSASQAREFVRNGLKKIGIRGRRALDDYSFAIMRKYFWGE